MYWRDWSYGKNTAEPNLKQSLLIPKKQTYFEHYCCFCDKKETKYVNNLQSSVYKKSHKNK